jgi:hypothetical protein
LTLDALTAFFDMWGGFLMFFLVSVFQYVAAQRVRPSGTAIPSRGASRFIAQKKVVAIGLAALLLGMAAYDLGLLAVAIHSAILPGHGAIESATAFYNDLFTVMIFTDVLILILSLEVSIILIRFSLTEGHPYGVPLAVMAMVFGILTLLVFNFLMRQNAPPKA